MLDVGVTLHADGVHVHLAEVFAALCTKTQFLTSALSIPGPSDELRLSDIENLSTVLYQQPSASLSSQNVSNSPWSQVSLCWA